MGNSIKERTRAAGGDTLTLFTNVNKCNLISVHFLALV